MGGDKQTYAAKVVEYCRRTAKAMTANVILRFLSILEKTNGMMNLE